MSIHLDTSVDTVHLGRIFLPKIEFCFENVSLLSIPADVTMETPKFTQIYEDYEVEMLQDAHDTITRLGLWDWLKNFKPRPNEGFMFASDIELAEISTALHYQGHSGASFGWTMREMHNIAQNGWLEHKYTVIEKRGASCPCRRAKGKLTGWCGVAGGGIPSCEH